jgi:steroid 5-alpha reductase family enzyme
VGTSRRAGFAVVALTYALAALAAWAVGATSNTHPLLRTLEADVAATLVVFALSMVVGNASLYDPYWSVAPAVIVPAWLLWPAGDVTARQIVLLLLVLAWATRLTLNWARSWQGLRHEDWRYAQLRTERPSWLPFWLVNLTGIQLVPTLIVFAALLPAWPATTVTDRPWGWLDIVATLVTAAAILLETTADRQLHRFAGNPANRGEIIDEGLWHLSRHPNYVGEMTFWWGVWLFALAAAPSWWWTVIGPLAMVALFAFVSVPLMDRRSLARRPAYADHMRRVPALVPLPGHRPR